MFNEQAFIDGTELAIDWNLPLPKEDLEKYYELIEKRRNENESTSTSFV